MTTVPIRLVKTVIPRQGIIKLKQIGALSTELLLRVWASSKLVSSLYYALPSRAFWREHYGVIYGRLKYSQSLKEAKDSNYLLRRNIHRLEKGLIMKPRREVFATSYIEATLDSYKNVFQASQGRSDPSTELQWAHDVLKLYFSVVTAHPAIDHARAAFSALETVCGSKNRYVPYKRDLSDPPPVSYDQFLKLSFQRRSVRWYLQKPVPRELIDQAITAAVLSPSACNRQPFELRVLDQPEMVQQVASIPMGTAGFSHNFPAIVVVVGKLRAYPHERDRHVIYIDGALASMSLMYALETLGLSSCPINWPDLEPQESQMATLINLEPDERVIMLISLGYPDPEGMVAYSQKKPLDQIRRYS